MPNLTFAITALSNSNASLDKKGTLKALFVLRKLAVKEGVYTLPVDILIAELAQQKECSLEAIEEAFTKGNRFAKRTSYSSEYSYRHFDLHLCRKTFRIAVARAAAKSMQGEDLRFYKDLLVFSSLTKQKECYTYGTTPEYLGYRRSGNLGRKVCKARTLVLKEGLAFKNAQND